MEEYLDTIKYCVNKNISLAGITSILFHEGIKMKYGEVRKFAFKECQRLDAQKFNKLND